MSSIFWFMLGFILPYMISKTITTIQGDDWDTIQIRKLENQLEAAKARIRELESE